MQKRLRAVLTVYLLSPSTLAILASKAQTSPPTAPAHRTRSVTEATKARQMTVRDLLDVNEVGTVYDDEQVQLSPDGQWVVFQMRKTLLEQNRYVFDLWLVATSGDSQPKQLTHNSPVAGERVMLTPRWSPDSKTVAYLSGETSRRQISLIRLDNMEREQLIGRDGMLQGGESQRDVLPTGKFRWSPDGKSMALLAESASREEPEPTRGVEVGINWFSGSLTTKPKSSSLYLFDLEKRTLRRLTEDSLNVQSFGWSPDGRQIAIAASDNAMPGSEMHSDLFVTDLPSGKIRTLLKQPGPDSNPVWSPDGKWIAFDSQGGNLDWLQVTMPAAIPASGGQPIYPTEKYLAEVWGSPKNLHWSSDSKELYFTAPHHMTTDLFRVPILGGSKPVMVTPDDNYLYSQSSYSDGNRLTAFTRQSVTEPADVFVSSLSTFKPSRLTSMNPQLNDVARATVETVKWRSKDDRWDIHGVLVKPPDYRSDKKYPLLVFLEGGPGMVSMRYEFHAQYPINVLAARGYLILAPNTRGRGGYGKTFHQAIGNEGSRGYNPSQDVLAGVDLLVARGIADPDRLGVMGFSYGGYLTAYALTQTNRFKSASVGDGVPMDNPHGQFQQGGIPWRMDLARTMGGMGSPYDPVELSKMMQESPLHHVQHVKTPVLLEYGHTSSALAAHGQLFFQGLQHFEVPSELVVYPRTGHGIEEPLLREDSTKRNVAWFDYWLLEEPYTDAMKQAKYDRWKTQH